MCVDRVAEHSRVWIKLERVETAVEYPTSCTFVPVYAMRFCIGDERVTYPIEQVLKRDGMNRKSSERPRRGLQAIGWVENSALHY